MYVPFLACGEGGFRRHRSSPPEMAQRGSRRGRDVTRRETAVGQGGRCYFGGEDWGGVGD